MTGSTAEEPPRIDRAIIGEQIGISEQTVRVEATRSYALATNDENHAYLDAVELIAPPMYQVVLAFAAMPRDVMAAFGLDVLGTRIGLHAEQDMHFLAPICPGETICTDARVAAIEDHPLGEMVRIAIHSRTNSGEDRCRATWSILFIDDRDRVVASRAAPRSQRQADRPLAEASMYITGDQSLRYAAASGDNTRTHVDKRYAQSWGYPTYLLQGLCTMAFACKAVIDELAGGDPRRLRRLSVRFSGPVFPEDTLTTTMRGTESPSSYAFETSNGHGARVLSRGIACL
jgi:acyl dehydratase